MKNEKFPVVHLVRRVSAKVTHVLDYIYNMHMCVSYVLHRVPLVLYLCSTLVPSWTCVAGTELELSQ